MADDDKKTPLQRAFEEMDEDNSGTLDREEARSLCEMASKSKSKFTVCCSILFEYWYLRAVLSTQAKVVAGVLGEPGLVVGVLHALHCGLQYALFCASVRAGAGRRPCLPVPSCDGLGHRGRM